MGSRPKITVSADGAGVLSHAGLWLLADLADQTTLTAQPYAPSPVHGKERDLLAVLNLIFGSTHCRHRVAGLRSLRFASE